MNSNLSQNFVYCHKKFHHSKRLRTDSNSSSIDVDNESIKLELESTSENSDHTQTAFEAANTLNFIKVENKLKRALSREEKPVVIQQQPLAKRARFSASMPLHPNTCATAAAAAAAATTAILPKINDETLRSICRYHRNMVRKFPKKERTPKDQERRNKNTIACRMSRRVKKLEHIAIEEQYKEFSKQTFDIIEQSVRATAYLQELIKLTNCEQQQAKEIKTENSTHIFEKKISATRPQKKPFTIEFLVGEK